MLSNSWLIQVLLFFVNLEFISGQGTFRGWLSSVFVPTLWTL